MQFCEIAQSWSTILRLLNNSLIIPSGRVVSGQCNFAGGVSAAACLSLRGPAMN